MFIVCSYRVNKLNKKTIGWFMIAKYKQVDVFDFISRKIWEQKVTGITDIAVDLGNRFHSWVRLVTKPI